MSLFPIIAVLFLEQVRPLSEGRFVINPLTRYAALFERQFNDGQRQHGRIAWLLAVGIPVLLLLALQVLLWSLHGLFLFLLSVAVLYLTFGFRHRSHFFTDIHVALRAEDVQEARRLLAEWRNRSGDRLSSSEVARLSIEEALISVHQHVLAPMFWFAILGPVGALLYRLALFFKQHWGERTAADHGEFGQFSRRTFHYIDWLPIRLSAIGFAVVGDFEDALYCWRTQAHNWPDDYGILLAAGGGALGVRLGLPLHYETSEPGLRPELGMGEEADADFLQSTIGLVWRTLILGLLVLALLWVGSWV